MILFKSPAYERQVTMRCALLPALPNLRMKPVARRCAHKQLRIWNLCCLENPLRMDAPAHAGSNGYLSTDMHVRGCFQRGSSIGHSRHQAPMSILYHTGTEKQILRGIH
jgi:hypothetical protein